MNTFNYGSYYGMSHQDVLGMDPHYIVHCYENLMDNGGISREIYRQAIMVIHADDQSDLDYDEEAAIIREEIEDEMEEELLGC